MLRLVQQLVRKHLHVLVRDLQQKLIRSKEEMQNGKPQKPPRKAFLQGMMGAGASTALSVRSSTGMTTAQLPSTAHHSG